MKYNKEIGDEDSDDIPNELRIRIRRLISEIEKYSQKINSGGETNEKQK